MSALELVVCLCLAPALLLGCLFGACMPLCCVCWPWSVGGVEGKQVCAGLPHTLVISQGLSGPVQKGKQRSLNSTLWLQTAPL